MAQAFEQLWYTWATHGLEGRSRAQVRAASPGLVNLDDRLTLAALRLCRYGPAPPGADQSDRGVSFGWVDLADQRFVFRRVRTHASGNRPAAFAAHLIVGNSQMLPVTLVSRLYRAGFWLADDDPSAPTELPRLDRDELLDHRGDLAPVDDSRVVRFVAQLLAAREVGDRFSAYEDSGDLADLMARACDVLPRELIEILSFSSFEGAQTSSWFDVVGLDRGSTPLGRLFDAGGDSGESVRMLTAARALVSNGTQHPSIRASLAVAAPAGAALDVTSFVSIHEALDELDRGGAVDLDRLVAALRYTDGAGVILADARALDAIASALLVGDRAVFSALRQTLVALPMDISTQLGVALTAAWCRSRPMIVGAWLASLRQCSASVEEEFLRGAVGDLVPTDGKVATLDLAARFRFLTYLHRRGTTTGRSLAWLIDAPRADALALAREDELPVSWRARAMAPFIADIDGLDAAVSLSRVHPEALGHLVAAGVGVQNLALVIQRLPFSSARRGALEVARAVGLAGGGDVVLEAALATSTTPKETISLCSSIAKDERLAGSLADASIAARLMASVRGVVRSEFHSRARQVRVPGTAADAMVASGDIDAGYWLELDAIWGASFLGMPFEAEARAWEASVRRAIRFVDAMRNDENYSLATELLFRNAAASAPNLAYFNWLGDLIAERSPSRERDLSRVLRIAEIDVIATEVLRWVLTRAMWLVNEGAIAEMKGRSTRSDAYDKSVLLARQCLNRILRSERRALEVPKDMGSRGKKWWGDVQEPFLK